MATEGGVGFGLIDSCYQRDRFIAAAKNSRFPSQSSGQALTRLSARFGVTKVCMSGDALQKTFPENPQLFADGEGHFTAEDVVLSPRDFF